MSNYKRIASLKTADDFASYIETAGVKLQFDPSFNTGRIRRWDGLINSTASRSAIDSAFCRWKVGTGPKTASRPS
jgi:hypothetical protein